jgi:isoquinoline 1-oxidoreductase beta subunit
MAKEKKNKRRLSRRAFLITGGVLGTGLIVGVGGLLHVNKRIRAYSGTGMGEGTSLNAWIRIAPDNSITLAIPRAEMGQGVYTSLPALIAEELEVDMASIRVVHPQPEAPYANTFVLSQEPPNFFDGYSVKEKLFSYLTLIITGGSTSIPDGFLNMRYAGATARELLKRAAAQRWGIAVAECTAKDNHVINTTTQERLPYGELAEAAADIDLKELPELKPKADWRLIGQPLPRLDIPEKVDGRARFGLDVRPEGLRFAALRHPSVIGGKITGISNRAEIEAKPGVEKVVLTEYGAAVIADNTWRAKNAALALDLEEEDAGNVDLSSATIAAELDRILDEPPLATPEAEGDVEAAFAESTGIVVEARYDVPYLAHAALEPLNCTVRVADDEAEVWVGHQASSAVLGAVARVTGLGKDRIRIHTTYLGGGFGRRGEADFVLKAAAVAQELPGVPVMTVFTREEDMRNDMYRPVVASRLRALVRPDGQLSAWDHKIATQSVLQQSMGRMIPSMNTDPEDDITTVEGARELPYHMENRRVAFGNLALPIQVGFWRSVGSSQNAFFTECFLDECAHAAGMDPYEFRRAKLDAHPRFKKVLEKVAALSNWGQPLPEGRFRGIALHKSFGSIVGEVAEITRRGEKEFSIDRFYAVIDCGTYVNPDTIEAQLQGGIVFGLTAALYGEITWNEGAVEQYNFPQYEMVRMPVAPEVIVHIMENDEYPGGVGEPGTPPAAPALANALFAATGERVRALPLVRAGYRFS